MKKFVVRFEDDVYEELSNIAQLTSQSMNSVLNIIVREKYDTINGDPKVKKAFEQLNKLKETLENMSREFNA